MADVGTMFGSMGTGFYAGLVKAGIGGAWIIGIIIIAIPLLYVLRFKHKVTLIFESAGGGKRKKMDRGWFNKKKNEFKLLKHNGVECAVPDSKHEYINGKNIEYIATVRNNSASWLTITENPHFIPANYDVTEKLTLKLVNQWSILQPKQGFWDKYGVLIMQFAGWGALIVVTILIMQRMDAIIALGNNAAQASLASNKQVIESVPIILFSLWKRNKVKQE